MTRPDWLKEGTQLMLDGYVIGIDGVTTKYIKEDERVFMTRWPDEDMVMSVPAAIELLKNAEVVHVEQ